MKKQNQDEPADLPKNAVLGKLIERGIPVWKAVFHNPINNADETPESYFSTQSAVASRNVQMWWINGDGLLCFQKGKYFMVPSATVIFAKFD